MSESIIELESRLETVNSGLQMFNVGQNQSTPTIVNNETEFMNLQRERRLLEENLLQQRERQERESFLRQRLTNIGGNNKYTHSLNGNPGICKIFEDDIVCVFKKSTSSNENLNDKSNDTVSNKSNK